MITPPAAPKRIRGRMPAKVVCTYRFVATETNTWARLLREVMTERAAELAAAGQGATRA